MSERFVTTPPGGSRDTLYERRSALSRDLLGDDEGKQNERRSRTRLSMPARTESKRASRRKVRVPELALGLVLVLGGAFTASMLAAKRTETIRIVGAARDIERGRAIEADDLVASEVERRFAGSMITAEEAASLLGRVLVTDVPAGTPIVSSLLRASPTLNEGEEVVSLRIEVGDVPPSVAVGDVVRVVLVPDPALSVDTALTEFDRPAKIWDILEPTESSPDYVVSLVVPKEFLAKAALAGRSKVALMTEIQQVVQ